MHDVKALIAKSEALQSKAGQFSNAVVCPLSQGYSLLPITDAFADELSTYQSASSSSRTVPIKEISPGLLIVATEISQLAPVAYITTEYFGGQGGQDAVVWDKGNLVFSPSVQGYDRVWPDSPISQALRSIGVVAEEGKDEFDTVGLGNHRETHRWAESVGYERSVAARHHSTVMPQGERPMKPRITVITIGVDDLEGAVRFYRDGLGLKTDGIIGKEFEHGAVAFFDLQAGLKLAVWPRTSIAHDSGLLLTGPSATEFTLGHNVSSKAEVDAVMKQAQDAGAFVVKPAQETFWGGYAGYFQDPDQHLWEVVWNPQLLPQD